MNRYDLETGHWWYREGGAAKLGQYVFEMTKASLMEEFTFLWNEIEPTINSVGSKALNGKHRMFFAHLRMMAKQGGVALPAINLSPFYSSPSPHRVELTRPLNSTSWGGMTVAHYPYIDWSRYNNVGTVDERIDAIIDLLQNFVLYSNLPGMYLAQIKSWRPHYLEREAQETTAYMDEVHKLDRSDAGKRAHRILMEFLNPTQQEQYHRYGFFYVQKWGPMERYEKLPEEKRIWFKRPDSKYCVRRRLYRLQRSYTNGNIAIARNNGGIAARFCLHPKEPYPTDDVLLTQKLLIEEDEVGFLTRANAVGGLDEPEAIVVPPPGMPVGAYQKYVAR